MTVPFHLVSPAYIGSEPKITRSSVVLPEPTRPVTSVNMPRPSRRFTLLTPRPVSGCRYVRLLTSRGSKRSASVLATNFTSIFAQKKRASHRGGD